MLSVKCSQSLIITGRITVFIFIVAITIQSILKVSTNAVNDEQGMICFFFLFYFYKHLP